MIGRTLWRTGLISRMITPLKYSRSGFSVIEWTRLSSSTTHRAAWFASRNHPRHGSWEHRAFVPAELPEAEPTLSGATHRRVASARAALAGLNAIAKRLPDPHLLRTPALRREAQATSALEGTYAPFEEVLGADETAPPNQARHEILNYVATAQYAFDWVQDGRPLTVGLLETLQGVLVAGTPSAARGAGRVREEQVVIGRRGTAAGAFSS